MIQASDLVRLGAFTLPRGSGLDYGGTGLTLGPTGASLFIQAWAGEHGSAEFTIPGIGATATTVQPATASLEGKISLIGDDHGNGRNIGGQLVYNGKLYINTFVYYDSPSTAVASLFARPLNLATKGQVTGPVKVGSMNPGFTSGYMGTVPSAWQAALGGPVVTGNCCLSIISRTSYGPALFAFDPANPSQAKALLYYDEQHQTLGQYGAVGPNPIYNGCTRVTGVALTGGCALFFGSTGTGKWAYGLGSDLGDPSDPSGKGDHAYPYVGYVWAYDLNDLAAVAAGTKKPWEPVPYATWTLGPAGNNFSTGGTAYDPATNRIYFSRIQGDGPNPLIEVYQIKTGTTPTPPPPVPVPPPTPTPTPVPTPPPPQQTGLVLPSGTQIILPTGATIPAGTTQTGIVVKVS